MFSWDTSDDDDVDGDEKHNRVQFWCMFFQFRCLKLPGQIPVVCWFLNAKKTPITVFFIYCLHVKFVYFSMWSLFQVVVQYDKDLLEVWDEAKRLRCEWFNDYEKTASKPPMVIADLDVIQLDFRGELTTICLFWLGMSSRLSDIHLLLQYILQHPKDGNW